MILQMNPHLTCTTERCWLKHRSKVSIFFLLCYGKIRQQLIVSHQLDDKTADCTTSKTQSFNSSLKLQHGVIQGTTLRLYSIDYTVIWKLLTSDNLVRYFSKRFKFRCPFSFM